MSMFASIAMGPLTADVPTLQSARVTLDVLHTGVIWGWLVTMNMWTKSISTGALLVGATMLRRKPKDAASYRLWMSLLGFAFINLTLLFTLLDLHQPLRFWHMFLYPHKTSSLNVGAWTLSAFDGLLLLLIYAAWKKIDRLYERLLWPTLVLAFFATIYTAALMGQATARELWSTPTEVAQMILSALVAGSSALLLLPSPTDEERLSLGWILGLSAAVALAIFVAEVVFAPQKSEEAVYVIGLLVHGPLRLLFFGGLTLAFVVPSLLVIGAVRSRDPRALRLAAVSSLVGLWMVKHAWLIAPQLLPLS